MRGGLGCLVSFQRVLGGVGANREQMTCWVLLKGDLWERRDPIELLGVSGAPLLARPAVHRCGADRGKWRADLRAVVTSEGRGRGTCRSTPARPRSRPASLRQP